MAKTPGQRKSLEELVKQQLGHPGKYVNLRVKPRVIDKGNDHYIENKDKRVRPLSQNLSYKTYCKLKARKDNWGKIYQELAGLRKNQDKSESSEIPPDTGEWRKFLAETPQSKVKSKFPKPDKPTVEIENRPVRVIGGAIKRYKNTYMRKKGSKTGISGRDLFKKREEIDYHDLIQESWISRKIKNGKRKTGNGLWELAEKWNHEKCPFGAYIHAKIRKSPPLDRLEAGIHDICKDPSFEENKIKRYAHVQSFSERRGKSYGELAAKWGKEVLSDSFYEKLYREEARGNLEPKGNLEANLTEAASGGFEPGLDPFGRDIDTITNDFNPRFQVALETELTNRQNKITDLLAEGYYVRSAKESADIERILKWEPDFDGIGKRQIEREKSKIRETLRAKFPDKVVDNSNFNPENLDNWKIYSDKEKLKEHLKKVEKRQKEEKGDRIKAGFNFGGWPKDNKGYPLLYTKSKIKPGSGGNIPRTETYWTHLKPFTKYTTPRGKNYNWLAKEVKLWVECMKKRQRKGYYFDLATEEAKLAVYEIKWWNFCKQEIEDHPRRFLMCGPKLIFYTYVYILS